MSRTVSKPSTDAVASFEKSLETESSGLLSYADDTAPRPTGAVGIERYRIKEIR